MRREDVMEKLKARLDRAQKERRWGKVEVSYQAGKFTVLKEEETEVVKEQNEMEKPR